MNKISLIAIVLIGFVVVSSLGESYTVISGDSTHLREYNATWFPDNDPRIIILEGFEIAKTSNTSEQADEVIFFLDDFNQTIIYFEYFEAAGSTNSKGNLTSLSEAAFAFALRSYIVFEYVDLNGVPGFQFGQDNFTGLYDLSSLELEWKPMVINSSEVTTNGQTFKVWSVTIETIDEVFLMSFIVCGTPLQVGPVSLTPDSMKIDFQVNWFTDLHVPTAWTTGVSNPEMYPNASVGIAMVMAAGAETFNYNANSNTSKTSTNSSFEFVTEGYTGFFSWEPTVNTVVNGYEAVGAVMVDTVVAGSNSNQTAGFSAEWIIREIFFSFEGSRPSSVSWDPELGSKIAYPTKNTTVPTSNAIIVVPSLMTVVALFIATLF